MSGFSGHQPRVEAAEMKTAAAYAERRMGREGETLRQAPPPQPGATPCLACGRRGSLRSGEASREPRPSSDAPHPPGGSHTRSAAWARGLGGGGNNRRVARPAPASGFAHARRRLGPRPGRGCNPRGLLFSRRCVPELGLRGRGEMARCGGI